MGGRVGRAGSGRVVVGGRVGRAGSGWVGGHVCVRGKEGHGRPTSTHARRHARTQARTHAISRPTHPPTHPPAHPRLTLTSAPALVRSDFETTPTSWPWALMTGRPVTLVNALRSWESGVSGLAITSSVCGGVGGWAVGGRGGWRRQGRGAGAERGRRGGRGGRAGVVPSSHRPASWRGPWRLIP